MAVIVYIRVTEVRQLEELQVNNLLCGILNPCCV